MAALDPRPRNAGLRPRALLGFRSWCICDIGWRCRNDDLEVRDRGCFKHCTFAVQTQAEVARRIAVGDDPDLVVLHWTIV